MAITYIDTFKMSPEELSQAQREMGLERLSPEQFINYLQIYQLLAPKQKKEHDEIKDKEAHRKIENVMSRIIATAKNNSGILSEKYIIEQIKFMGDYAVNLKTPLPKELCDELLVVLTENGYDIAPDELAYSNQSTDNKNKVHVVGKIFIYCNEASLPTVENLPHYTISNFMNQLTHQTIFNANYDLAMLYEENVNGNTSYEASSRNI